MITNLLSPFYLSIYGVRWDTQPLKIDRLKWTRRAVARALIGGRIFIYSGSARLVSFEMKLISKEVSRAEPEYMNTPPPPPQLAF